MNRRRFQYFLFFLIVYINATSVSVILGKKAGDSKQKPETKSAASQTMESADSKDSKSIQVDMNGGTGTLKIVCCKDSKSKSDISPYKKFLFEAFITVLANAIFVPLLSEMFSYLKYKVQEAKTKKKAQERLQLMGKTPASQEEVAKVLSQLGITLEDINCLRRKKQLEAQA